jgi:hypothetical protein
MIKATPNHISKNGGGSMYKKETPKHSDVIRTTGSKNRGAADSFSQTTTPRPRSIIKTTGGK